MNRIASFEVDHTRLFPGMYVSRTDGDVITYDLRFIRPNTPPFLSNGALHTLEHLYATYLRNSRFGGEIVYFGPMGCRTGFYLLTRNGLAAADAVTLVRDATAFCAGFEGELPGSRPEECGNCREHDLTAARTAAAGFLSIMQEWTLVKLQYPSH